MKKQLLLFFIGILAMFTYSQAPEKFSYQAIIRDAGDAIVANTGIGMQISILKGSAGGTAVYVETHSPTTNANGLITLEIGGGSVVSRTFDDLAWSNDSYFIKTETDPSGGASYTITGTSQLLSVPYALHAKNVKPGAFSSIVGSTDYQFISDNQWRQFADLTTSITLDKTSDVLVAYNSGSSSPSPGSNYLATRLVINDSETNKMFRIIQGGGVQYYSNTASGVITLGAGTHIITVQYRTNVPPYPQNNAPNSSDYMGRGLVVKELN